MPLEDTSVRWAQARRKNVRGPLAAACRRPDRRATRRQWVDRRTCRRHLRGRRRASDSPMRMRGLEPPRGPQRGGGRSGEVARGGTAEPFRVIAAHRCADAIEDVCSRSVPVYRGQRGIRLRPPCVFSVRVPLRLALELEPVVLALSPLSGCSRRKSSFSASLRSARNRSRSRPLSYDIRTLSFQQETASSRARLGVPIRARCTHLAFAALNGGLVPDQWLYRLGRLDPTGKTSARLLLRPSPG